MSNPSRFIRTSKISRWRESAPTSNRLLRITNRFRIVTVLPSLSSTPQSARRSKTPTFPEASTRYTSVAQNHFHVTTKRNHTQTDRNYTQTNRNHKINSKSRRNEVANKFNDTTKKVWLDKNVRCGGTEHTVSERLVTSMMCQTCASLFGLLNFIADAHSTLQPNLLEIPWDSSEHHQTSSHSHPGVFTTIVRLRNCWHNGQPNALCIIDVSSCHTR